MPYVFHPLWSETVGVNLHLYEEFVVTLRSQIVDGLVAVGLAVELERLSLSDKRCRLFQNYRSSHSNAPSICTARPTLYQCRFHTIAHKTVVDRLLHQSGKNKIMKFFYKKRSIGYCQRLLTYLMYNFSIR